jgi:signal recognition particle receptor subunit beta
MSFVNYQEKKIHCKIVYYGPGLGGKTTNISHVYKKTAEGHRGQMVTLNTETDRTLFFDFLPLDLGVIRGFETRFHLYTVPGQVFYEASRKLILRGVDGIIFVVDSQLERIEDNIESFKSLEKNLLEQGYDLKRLPVVIQWNKRDLSNATPIEELKRKINTYDFPEIEASASNGMGVFETLKTISKLVLLNIKGGLD